MQEGFLVTYRDLISKSEKPANDLYSFYLEFFEVPKNIETFKSIARLVNLYGRDIVFKAIVSLESMSNLNHSNIYPLLRFMCNKLIEPMEAQKLDSLEKYRDNMEKLSDRARNSKWKVRSPFNE